jgi:CRISPR-associated endonuclease/helicase Cas3
VIEQFRGGEVADEEADRRLGERLAAALAGGGCAAVICNTVARAQRVYRALRDGGHFAPEEIDLLHARFLYEEREAREQRALIRFGKPGGRVATADGEVEVARPERAVLVATQVIEQSLDLDFDLMVTDLAPVDLVLQRVGRLHRHARPDRPRGLTEPVVWVRWPGERDGAPTLDPGDAAVYEPHVLLRSWWVLRDRMAIVIPDDVEALIEAVYDESGASPDDGSQRFRREWEDTLEGHRAAVAEERDEAEKRWLKAPTFSGATWRLIGEPREEDAPDFHKEFQALTRLAERSVEIVCLYGTRERPTFDRSGLDRATVRGMPSLEQAKRLLRRSVRVTARGAVAALLDGEVPAGWRKSALLRNHRLVVLEDGATAFVGTYRLRLDRDTGLEIERRGTEERE